MEQWDALFEIAPGTAEVKDGGSPTAAGDGTAEEDSVRRLAVGDRFGPAVRRLATARAG